MKPLLLLCLIGFVTSCHGDKPADSGHRGPSTGDGPSFDGLYGLTGLERSCQESGARFRVFKRECECPSLSEKSNPGEIFAFVRDRGACLQPTEARSLEESCQDGFTEAYLSGHLETLNRCLKTVLQFERTYLGVQIGEGTPASSVLALTRELDARRGRLFAKLWPTAEAMYFNSRITVLAGKAAVDADFVRSLIDPPPIDTNAPYRVTFLEPQPERILETWGHPLDLPLGLAPVPPALKERFGFLSVLEIQVGKALRENLNGEVLAAGECRRRCVVRQDLGQEGGFRFTREKFYLGGVPYRDLLRVERGAVLQGLVQFNLRGGVSAVLVLQEQATAQALLLTTNVYNRLWQGAGTVQVTILNAPAELRINAAQLSDRSGNAVVFCEPLDLPLSQSAGLSNHIRQNRGRSGALLGWLGDSAAEFASVRELVSGIWPASYAPEHGVQVASVLVHENPEAALIPVGLSGCLNGYSSWQGPAFEHGARIVNLSGTDPIDVHACQTLYSHQTLFGPEKPFLWVVAAGNTGVENPIDRCPQNLGRENLLVIAGSDGDSLWSHSDYGKRYADLAAPISSLGGDQGTSFSAPRVAAVAAKISSRFPSLSPELVRKILLASARVPFSALAVRSGGVLDAEAALSLAERTVRFPEKSWPEHWSQMFGPSESKRREALWRQNGLRP